uniref:Uncharacterized protein n=1 Tax=Amazona collaria TaxID=241587 RepID=A0A8B9FV21_9PSIT
MNSLTPILTDIRPARDDVCRKYRLLLKQLTYNSKRRIGMLTTLAEESQCLTKDIVSLIEEQITKVCIDPLLCLLPLCIILQ